MNFSGKTLQEEYTYIFELKLKLANFWMYELIRSTIQLWLTLKYVLLFLSY